MIVVLTGAPGAGKGTQAQLLEEREGFRKISTGDALRSQIKKRTPVGLKAQAFVESGRLVPDDVLLDVLKAELGTDPKEKILLDGYPRNLNQARTLESIATKNPLMAVIHLDVERQELVERLSGRRICSECGTSYHVAYNPPQQSEQCDRCGGGLVQREDDKEHKVAVRLDVYERETKPILDFYREKGLYQKISGSGDTEEVFGDLKHEIEKALG